MKMNIRKFAELTGVSVRTLHYYDEIDLLKPDFVDEQSGYRFYGDNALSRMQEIMFYRELDFSLKSIKEIISSTNYNKNEALRGQRELLILKKKRLEKIINAIEIAEKGEKIMNFNAFDNSEFEKLQKSYEKEAKSRWGNTDAYHEYEQKTEKYSAEKQNDIGTVMNKIISEFSQAMVSGVKATDKTAFELVKRLQDFITENQYTCTDDILLYLGEMYVADERFKKNIDKNGDGTAEFINEAIKAYCESKKI